MKKLVPKKGTRMHHCYQRSVVYHEEKKKLQSFVLLLIALFRIGQEYFHIK